MLSPQVNLTTARRLLHCCEVAFKEHRSTNKKNWDYALWEEHPDHCGTARLSVRNFEAAIFVFKTYSVVVIHHTNDLLDWKANLNLLPIRGFHGGYQKAAVEMSLALDRFISRPFYVTGHSMGGAIAAIYSLQHMYNDRWLGTYTFGNPRIALPSYKGLLDKRLSDRLINFRHTVDLVDYLPAFYEHIGHSVYVTEEGELVEHAAPSFLDILSTRPSQVYRNHQLEAFANVIEKAERTANPIYPSN